MKNAIASLLALLCLVVGAASLRAQQVMTLDSDRYADVGGGQVRFEQGTLYLDGTYIPSTSGVFPASQFGLDAFTLAQVSGQPVVTLDFYTQLAALAPG